MFGLFRRKPTIQKVLAEGVALSLSRVIKEMGYESFLNDAENLVIRECEMMGIPEELTDQEYR